MTVTSYYEALPRQAPLAQLRTTRLRLLFVTTYVVAFALWGLVALAAAGVIELPVSAMALLFLGGLAPTLAAVWATIVESGTRSVGALFGTLWQWRVKPAWYAVVLLAPAGVVVSALGIGVVLGSPLPPAPSPSAWLNVSTMACRTGRSACGGAGILIRICWCWSRRCC